MSILLYSWFQIHCGIIIVVFCPVNISLHYAVLSNVKYTQIKLVTQIGCDKVQASP